MATAIISTRLNDTEISELDSLAKLTGFDRSAVLKSILRKGIAKMKLELAIEKFRSDSVTLSKAAEISGLSQWDFIAQMEEAGLELHYGPADLAADISALS
ncbi:MAG: UPF0175 family protein [Verrucomicrobiales bacterium]|nr:UPF0175 family protein [Verrucomicrobiales bacterium]